jgi:hypothetical protein
VREGRASLEAVALGHPAIPIARGQIATFPPGAHRVAPARIGGAGISDLAALEARAGLGDLIGIRAFLFERVSRSVLAEISPRGASEIVRLGSEIAGADGGPAGAAIETGIRPPPFFESEVPPKGPNVRVEVTFGED